jgi:predicted membrane channel-forming protein YqfA (hemolysin III family)
LIDTVSVEIFTKYGQLIVASCYKPPTNNTIDRNDWTRFFAHLRVYSLLARTLTPTVFCGVEEKVVKTGW